MAITITPPFRAVATGVAASALLIGAFTLGAGRGGAAPAPAGGAVAGGSAAATGGPSGARLTSASGGAARGSATGAGARITVTGNGTVTGTPNQLTLGMGVQVSANSVGAALQRANQAVRNVTSALRAGGVAPADIQTSGLYVQPNYGPGGQAPTGYAASESLTATLNDISAAGGQIQAAVHAGGNAAIVDNVSLNLTDTSRLLATARARAVADARVKAAQYAQALGRPLGGVISISDQSTFQPVPQFAGAAASKAAASVPISPGSQQLSVSVIIVYALA